MRQQIVFLDTDTLAGTDLAHLILSPHVAWTTTESMQLLVQQLAEDILAFIAGSPVRTCNMIRPCL